MRRVFVRVRELYYSSLIIGPPHESDPRGEVVGGKPGWDSYYGHKHQECVQMRGPLRVYKGRIHSILDQRRLVLDGLVDDRIQLIVSHDFQNADHELVSSHQVLVVACDIRGRPQASLRVWDDLAEVRRTQHFLFGLEGVLGAPSKEHVEGFCAVGWPLDPRGQQFLQVRNNDGIDYFRARGL